MERATVITAIVFSGSGIFVWSWLASQDKRKNTLPPAMPENDPETHSNIIEGEKPHGIGI